MFLEDKKQQGVGWGFLLQKRGERFFSHPNISIANPSIEGALVLQIVLV